VKKQFILVGIGLIFVCTLYFFGRTTATKKSVGLAQESSNPEKTFDVQQFIVQEKAKLSPDMAVFASNLENGISRGDVLSQKIKANEALANFWKDSVKLFEPYAFYTSSASKLVNSEKNLTFAAQLFLENLRGEKDVAKLNWETKEAIDLFERAIKLNPNNDDLRIGLGSAYIYGKSRGGDPAQTMQGILELVNVVKKDSTNMKAQMMVGVGGLVSGQFDKAIARFLKVVNAQPQNAEAIAYLADAYAGKGNKVEAIRWFEVSKRLINNPHYTEEVNERIKTLK
jgi:tetratricopeptide (TPR) repeat protein